MHAVENINKLDKDLSYKDRRLLAYTMFFHDTGKPKCHIRRYSKLYGREVDSFFNHNIESVNIAERVLPSLNFTTQEQKIIKLLIKNHDNFMFITLKDDGNKHHKILSKDLIKNYINEFNNINDGIKLMKFLLLVGRADSGAQNPALTQKSFELLDEMTKMLDEFIDENKTKKV